MSGTQVGHISRKCRTSFVVVVVVLSIRKTLVKYKVLR